MPDTPALPVDSASPVELSKSQRKSVASAGYLVERFAAACDVLRKRVQDGRVSLPSPWKESVAGASSTSLQGDGWFVMEGVLAEDGKIRLLPHLLSQDAAAPVIAGWLTKNPGTPAEALLPVPDGFHISWWTAFLRLRPLRDFWEAELRRSSWEQLVALLPDAWLLDRTPLPPGAVIPRLELSGWEELSVLISPERAYQIHDGAAKFVSMESPSNWQRYLGNERSAGSPAHVLAEVAIHGDSARFQAIYGKRESRVELVGHI